MKAQPNKPLQVSRRTPILLVAAFLLTASAAWLGASGSQEGDDPLPFDPLSEAEQEQAIETALGDPQVAVVLSDRHEVIGAALNTDKHRLRDNMDSRAADVWLYDYGRDETIHVVVDLEQGTILTLTRSTDIQPPITVSEMEHAADIALAHKPVQDELEARSPYEELQPLARLWTVEPPGPCSTHRCALVTFEIDGDYTGDLFVLVDLSREQVDQIIEQGPDHSHKEVRH